MFDKVVNCGIIFSKPVYPLLTSEIYILTDVRSSMFCSHPRRQNYYGGNSSAASMSTISKQTDERDGDTTDTETNNTYDVPAAYENSRAVSEVNSTTTGISMGKSARSR